MNAWQMIAMVPVLGSAALWLPGTTSAGLVPQKHGSLVRVPDAADDEDSFDRDEWRTALLEQDLERREQNFEKLVQLARRDAEARRALEEWSREASGELAWTSRLALRDLDSRPGRWFRGPQGLGNQGWPQGFQLQLGDLNERLRGLESLFQDGAPFHMLEPGHGWSFTLPPSGLTPVPNGGTEQFQQYSLEVGPDSAKVKVKELVDGREETREYSADSLEELLDAHPELKSRIAIGGSFDWQPSFGGRPPSTGAAPSPADGRPPTHILGIEYAPPSAELVSSLGLEPGVGLFVERTVPGTIAHILGIKRGDVLVELNGNTLYSGDDISRVMRERLPDAEVVVTLVDARGQRRSMTWRPPEPKDSD